MKNTKELSRRGFLSHSSQAALIGVLAATSLKPAKAKAHEGEPTDTLLNFESTITRNHGHALELTPTQMISLAREASASESPAIVSIQGQSHPHDIELSLDDMVAIVLGGEVTKTSFGGTHTHDVTIKLNILS